MRRFISRLAIGSFAAAFLCSCGPVLPPISTGQPFKLVKNPMPDKMALVYFLRDDMPVSLGAKQKNFAGRLTVMKQLVLNGEDKITPVVMLTNKTYRPILFEPGEQKLDIFIIRTKSELVLNLAPGDTRCVDISRVVHEDGAGHDLTEIPFEQCQEKLRGLQLAKTLNELRKEKGEQPLVQTGFKDLRLAADIRSDGEK